MPEPLRGYIHDLETVWDPAGDVRELFRLQTENTLGKESRRMARHGEVGVSPARSAVGALLLSRSLILFFFGLALFFQCSLRALASWSHVSAICSRCWRWKGCAVRAMARHSAAC